MSKLILQLRINFVKHAYFCKDLTYISVYLTQLLSMLHIELWDGIHDSYTSLS